MSRFLWFTVYKQYQCTSYFLTKIFAIEAYYFTIDQNQYSRRQPSMEMYIELQK